MIDVACGEVNMSNYTVILLSACIPAVVTIIGFVVTYFLNKRNFEEEVSKQKTNIQLSNISDLPHQIQLFLDDMRKGKKVNQETVSKLKSLTSIIFAYGSKEAIMLETRIQELNYALAETPKNDDTSKSQELTACFILLLCQVKWDLTGIEITPEFWYRMHISDYNKRKESFISANNEIVKSLDLRSFLLIE